jgi:hypothetical protein
MCQTQTPTGAIRLCETGQTLMDAVAEAMRTLNERGLTQDRFSYDHAMNNWSDHVKLSRYAQPLSGLFATGTVFDPEQHDLSNFLRGDVSNGQSSII